MEGNERARETKKNTIHAIYGKVIHFNCVYFVFFSVLFSCHLWPSLPSLLGWCMSHLKLALYLHVVINHLSPKLNRHSTMSACNDERLIPTGCVDIWLCRSFVLTNFFLLRIQFQRTRTQLGENGTSGEERERATYRRMETKWKVDRRNRDRAREGDRAGASQFRQWPNSRWTHPRQFQMVTFEEKKKQSILIVVKSQYFDAKLKCVHFQWLHMHAHQMNQNGSCDDWRSGQHFRIDETSKFCPSLIGLFEKSTFQQFHPIQNGTVNYHHSSGVQLCHSPTKKQRVRKWNCMLQSSSKEERITNIDTCANRAEMKNYRHYYRRQGMRF